MAKLTKSPDVQELRKRFAEFLPLYLARPIQDNAGGMGLNHSFALWSILRDLTPKLFVESGVWKGHSTWIVELASPSTKIRCFDLDFKVLQFKSQQARYIESDFQSHDWSEEEDLNNSLIMFDDHQNVYERIKSAYFFGFRNMIIEDNFPVGEGDGYSLKHIFAADGFTSMQQSEKWKGTKRQQFQRARQEKFLKKFGISQTRIVNKNIFDGKNLEKNIEYVYEFPPIWLEEYSIYGPAYAGNYKTEHPILSKCPFPGLDYSYGYLTHIGLK
jgi:hypothetical protein